MVIYMPMGYVIILKPKVKTLPIRTICPYKKRIKWTKKRALQEINYVKEHRKFQYKDDQTFEYALTEIYTPVIVTEKYAKNKGYID